MAFGFAPATLLDNPAVRIAVSISLFIILINVIVYALPVVPFPTEVESALSWLFESLWAFDFMLPVNTLVYAFGIVALSDITLAGLKLLLWINGHLVRR